ncbi:glutamine synthetase [Streptomyces umbrinus]|uniref:Glutamine synthetase n=1 Tax=Streptomyces umbrinus TaxID=67370 RepID=A0ABU0T7E4_9ACTN|nr:hypothetical protein [Streptomyces umbrinus]MDQ1031477.1 glutamine synthetase [Streptomyces umbrinus]
MPPELITKVVGHRLTDGTYGPGTVLPTEQELADLRSSKIALDAFGPAAVRHYACAARHEIRWHRHRVTDTERERGFDRA